MISPTWVVGISIRCIVGGLEISNGIRLIPKHLSHRSRHVEIAFSILDPLGYVSAKHKTKTKNKKKTQL